MSRRTRLMVCALLVAAGALAWGRLSARESNGTAAAKTAFAAGEAAAREGKLPEAAAAFRKAITADADFVDAHQRFIEVTQRADTSENRSASAAQLRQLYERWAREHPKRAVYQWALGFLTTDGAKADVFLKQAIALDPSFARAYFQLAKNADDRTDWAAQRQYLKSAVDSNPDEPRYLLRYAVAQRRIDPAKFRELAQQVADTFPTSPSAAEALYNLANQSTNPERRAILDRVRANYPFDRFTYAVAAMNELYGELPPSDALALAREVAKAQPTNRTWQQRVTLQEALTQAAAMVGDKRFTDALALLDKTQRPSGPHGVAWTLTKAEAAAGANRPDQAYAALIDAAVLAPDARIDAALRKYGNGKTAQEIDADIWRARDAKATVAPLFELPPAPGGAPVKLADYRGRSVVVAFWYPT